MNESHGTANTGYNRFLLLVAGWADCFTAWMSASLPGRCPYLEATSGLNAGQLSFIVAAVLLGSVISTLFAGAARGSGWAARTLMIFSGMLFVISIPVIALAHGYGRLVFGRLLQGISAGLIGVVVPLYLAECLSASNRGKGTGIFQWLLTLGIVAAALIGMYFSYRVEEVAKLGDAGRLFAFKDTAWRSIFWVSLPPGILFVIGSFMVAESPRWLFRRGKTDAAHAALLRSRTAEQAEIELQEMEETVAAEKAKTDDRRKSQGISVAPQIRHSVCAGLRHSCVQPAHRHQLHHRLQHQHSDSEPAWRRAGPLGLCHFHACQFPDDHRWLSCWSIAKAANFCCPSAARASSFRSFAPALLFRPNGKTARRLPGCCAGHGYQPIRRSRSRRSMQPRPRSCLAGGTGNPRQADFA